MNIDRRRLVTGLAACPVCAGSARAASAPWAYGDEETGRWGDADPAYRTCATGDQQSPVDLHDGVRAQVPQAAPHWLPGAHSVINNGHTLQLNVSPGSWTDVGAARSQLAQFHFHTPSEHAVGGRRSAMEAHFVHQRGDELTVLGVFLAAGTSNDAFAAIIRAAPATPGEAPLPMALDPSALLPKARSPFWRYEGSLTTPPCSQTVHWIVFDQAVTVAPSDIAAFRRIFPVNARPVQPLNRRFLLRG